jgi:uncharacterized protein (TIGR01777 family)
MRILITGGSGFLGSALSANLAVDGHEVILLSRNPEKAKGHLAPGVGVARWDSQTAEGWANLAEGAGAIINLAGESIAGANPLAGRWTPARKVAIHDSRTEAGKAVVEAVRAASQKPAVLVQASAVGYYGPLGDEPATEDRPAGNDFLARVCVDWEASTAEVEKLGVRRVVVRTGLPLGVKGGALPPLRTIANLGAGGPMGSGKQWWPWIHLEDWVAAVRRLIEDAEASGAYNVCAPNPVRQADFFHTLGQVMSRPSFMPTPAFALRLIAGEMADAALLAGQREVPSRLEKMNFKFEFPELAAALQDLVG